MNLSITAIIRCDSAAIFAASVLTVAMALAGGPLAQSAVAQPAAAETAKIAASETVAQANGNGVFQLTDLVVEVLQEGNGTTGRVGQTMVVEFTSWIMEGGQPTREFDSTSARGGPFSFVLGRNQAIKGWDVGLKGMRVGSRLRLTVPPNMAYGERGFAGPSAFVPPGAWVMSEVTLLEVR